MANAAVPRQPYGGQTIPDTRALNSSNEQTWQAAQAQLDDYWTQRYRQNPGLGIPQGYELGQDGKIHKKGRSIFIEHPWLIPLAGVGAGAAAQGLSSSGLFAGGAAATGAGTGAGAGAADAAGLSEAAVNGGGLAAGGGGGAAAASGAGGISTALKLASTAPSIVGMFKRSGNDAGGSGTNSPQLQQLQQLQVDQAQQSAPVKKALIALAQRLMPQGGLR